MKIKRFIIVISILFLPLCYTVFTLWDHHQTKQKAKHYLQEKYPGIEFKIGTPYKPWFTKAKVNHYIVPTDAYIADRKIHFMIYFTHEGSVESDGLIHMNLESVAKAEMEKVLKEMDSSVSVNINSLILQYDKTSSTLIEYSKELKGYMNIVVGWDSQSPLTKEEFVEKSVVMANKIIDNKFQVNRFMLSYRLNESKDMSIELTKEEINLPKEQLLEKITR